MARPYGGADAAAHAAVHHQFNADFVQYSHAALGSPPVSTLIAALRNGFIRGYPRLTQHMVSSNPPISIATAHGRLDQNRQGQRTTRPSPIIRTEDSETDPPAESAADDEPYVVAIELSNTNHSDLTGKFPHTSQKGNNYLLVSVYNGYIHTVPMASRHASSYITAYRKTLHHYSTLNHHPKFQRMDNETSEALERYLRSEGLTLQYVPPSNHRANKAERAIRVVKNTLISMLFAVHKDFPMEQWDELVPQLNIVINLLRPSLQNPQVSAYEGMHGHTYDFSAHPIAPPGTKVLTFDPPSARPSWAPHGTLGFYLGPALDHYRCFRVYVPATRSICITDTLAWFPEPFRTPGSSPEELLHAALTDITQLLQSLPMAHRTPHNPDIHNGAHDRVQQLASQATTALRDLVHHYTSPVPADAAQPPPPPLPNPPGLPFPPHPRAAEHTVAEQRVVEQRAAEQTAEDQRVGEQRVGAQRVGEQTHTAPPNNPTTSNNPKRRRRRARKLPDRLADFHLAPLARAVAHHTAGDQTPSPSQSDLARAYAALNLQQNGQPLTYAKAKAGPEASNWFLAEHEELSRLIDSGTIRPIANHALPADRRRDVTYYNPQPKEKVTAEGAKTFRIRGTAGGDRIHYPGEVSAHTAEMEVIKALIHSVASDRTNGRHCGWMTLDIKDFYLGTPMERPEYVRIKQRFIPDTAMKKYLLEPLLHDDAVLFEINKCMYGLPQAGLLSQQRLIAHLATNGYIQDPLVSCLFKHAQRGTIFTLVVDDFGVKYQTRDDADHLIRSLQQLYEIKIDWGGRKYLGFTIEFDDSAQTVSLSMPEYVPKLLERFHPDGPVRGVGSPAIYTPPNFGHTGPQEPEPEDTSSPLLAEDTKRLQEIVGSFLFYARAVDCTMLTAVNHIASLQAKPTQKVMEAAERLISYAAAYPSHKLVYHACDMVLHIQSDASFLSRPGSRSVAGGIHYLGNTNDPDRINGALLAVSSIINCVVASAAEAEYAACFINGQHGAWLRIVLEALGYPQPPTHISCDNSCAVGLATNTFKAKKSKAIDMRFHWIRDRIQQGQFNVTWSPGATNLADFFTKALPVKRHLELKPLLVQGTPDPTNPSLPDRLRQSHARRLTRAVPTSSSPTRSLNIFDVLQQDEAS